MFKQIVCGLALVALTAGCKKKDEAAGGKDEAGSATAPVGGSAAGGSAAAAAAAPADGLVEIPNLNGFVAKVPAAAKPNGIGGAAGFHSEDDSFQFTLREISAEEAAETFEAAKESTIAKSWIASDQTADGWVMRYVVPWMVMKGEEMKEEGVRYAFDVRRKIADKTFSCSGSLIAEAGYDASIAACNSIKAK